MALTKAEMAEHLFEELGLNKREAKEIVELFFEEIRACLENNEKVKLSGFGNFDLRDKAQRPGRNPKTGERVDVPPKKIPYFKMGKELKGLLNAERPAEEAPAAAATVASMTVGTPYSLLPGCASRRRATSFCSMTTAKSIRSCCSMSVNRKGEEIE